MTKQGKKRVEIKERVSRQASHKTRDIALANIKIYLTSLLEKWLFALSITLTPYAVVPALVTIGLFLYSKSQEGSTRITLEIFEIISSSVFTAVVVQNWIEAKGNTALAKKSITSIRYLQSLKYKVRNVTDRIKLFNKKDDRDFEEILNLISNIDKDILNSISDWADINPASVEIVDYFEDMKLKEDSINKLKDEIKTLKEQKEKLYKDKKTGIEKLEGDIAKKESRISELQEKISEQSLSNISIASGTFPTQFSSPTVSRYIVINSCKKCGKPLSLTDQFDTNPQTQELCTQCKGSIGF